MITRGRTGSTNPNWRASWRKLAASSACGRSSFLGSSLGSNGDSCSGAAFGVTFWPRLEPPPPPPNPSETSAARVEHGVLIEIDGQVFAIEPVGDGTFLVMEDTAQDRSAREKLRRMFHCDRARQAIFSHECRGGSIGDERAALLDEFFKLCQPIHAHAAANIVAVV